MAVDCTGALTANITYDCANAPVGGIEQSVKLINQADIDYAETTFSSTNPALITSLVLKADAQAYTLTGVKQTNGKSWELVKKDNAPDKFMHAFSGVILNPSAANKLQASALAQGSRYVVVVEQKWKGVNSADAFEVLGIRAGLEIATMTNNSAENDNTIVLTLASASGFEEPNMAATLLETDYATTLLAFNNDFAAD